VKVEYGQIWTADLSPTVANEQGGYRPVVVVSGANFNGMSINQAMVMAITTRDRRLPHHVAMDQKSGLHKPSWAMAETVRAVSTTRFDRHVGWAESEVMRLLAGWIEFFTMP
jgi:mRNA interferase MazF